jgi:ABC-2 type transport system permease protein
VRTVTGCYPRVAMAGFRRYSSYRQAAVAGTVTNTVFGFLRVGVLLAALGGRAQLAGYDQASAVTYVWLGQGLLAVVLLWGEADLAERVRTGDVVVDLSRPWNLQVARLAEDLGRAGYAVLGRFLPPVLIGMFFFPFRWPKHTVTWALFALSVLLAVMASFAIRFLIDLSAFWLLEVRGIGSVYRTVAGVLSGLVVPLVFFPDWARTALWFTPFPDIMQSSIDVFVERGSGLWLIAHQVASALVLLAIGQFMLRRAERKLVVQGG